MLQKSKCICLVLFSLFLSYAHVASAQTMNTALASSMVKQIEGTKTILSSISLPLNSTKAAQVFLEEHWAGGVIFLIDHKQLNCLARYNVLRDRIELKLEDEIRKLRPEAIYGIALDDRLLVNLIPGEKGDAFMPGYFEVLVAGSISLLEKYKPAKHSAGGTSLHPTLGNIVEYKIERELYYARNEEKPKKLRKGKKNILKLVADQSNEIEAYVESEGLHYRKEKDLIAIISKYNSMQ